MKKTWNPILLPLAFLPAAFLFMNIGTYSLWDDETMTSLIAQGVRLSGDTSAQLGDNIVAYREGIALRGLKDRFSPPLPTYLVALSMQIFGSGSFSARLPFILAGLLSFFLVIFWMSYDHLPWPFQAVLIIGILGNVSLLLYFRQARYYGLVILFFLALLYFYSHPKANLRWALGGAGCITGLFLTHPLAFVSVGGACLADSLIFGRKQYFKACLPLSYVFVPAGFVIGISLFIWNPYLTKHAEYQQHITIVDRLTLFVWNWRDATATEFFSPILMIAALVLGVIRRSALPFRLSLAIFIIITLASAITHQMVSVTSVADIRYIIPIIPLGIWLSGWFIWTVLGQIPWLAIAAAFLVFWTNIFNGFLINGVPFRSTPILFFGELLHPNPEPYAPTARWIQQHVHRGQSIWVLPDYMTYPLMFHAPEAVYAWQLDPKQRSEPQFSSLPDIHFKGLVMPDYIVAFGPVVQQVRQLCSQWAMQGVRYREEARLFTFWKDLYRPELFWRTFKPIENFDPNTEAIYIFQRQT